MSVNEYASKVLLSVILFSIIKCSYTLERIYRYSLESAPGVSGFGNKMIIMFLGIMSIYTLYIYLSATMKRFELVGIPKIYSISPIFVFGFYGASSLFLGIFIPNHPNSKMEELGTVIFSTMGILMVLMTIFASICKPSLNEKS